MEGVWVSVEGIRDVTVSEPVGRFVGQVMRLTISIA